MQPSETFWVVFGWFGILTAAGLVVLMAYCAFDALMGAIGDWRWKHKYKHRFDKQPTAACYCKDCYYHAKDDKCENVTWADRYTPDNGFCYEAEPRKKDIDND